MGVDFLDRRVLAKRVVDGRKPASGHESHLRQGVASGHPRGRSAAKEPQSGLTRRNPLTFDPTCCGFSHSLFAIYARFYAAVNSGSTELRDTVHARGMAGWRHAFGDTDPSSTFTLSNSPGFTVMGAPTAEDVLVAELGIETGLSDNAVLGVAYKGRYGGGATDHGFNAALKVMF